jgi:hypothetical protein
MAQSKTTKKRVARTTGSDHLTTLLKKGCTTEQYAEAAGVEISTARVRLRAALQNKEIVRYMPTPSKDEQKARSSATLLSYGTATRVRRKPHYKFA